MYAEDREGSGMFTDILAIIDSDRHSPGGVPPGVPFDLSAIG
jgi:hypothetical protein